MKTPMTRRKFIAASAVALAAPRVFTAQKSPKQLVVGTGAHRYEVWHDWPQLPEKYSWQTTHNVAVDREGRPTRVPRLQAAPGEEAARVEAANQRRADRLARRART